MPLPNVSRLRQKLYQKAKQELTVNAEGRTTLREPDAVNPPVRFDEGELNGRAAVQFPTLPGRSSATIHDWGAGAACGIRKRHKKV